MMIPETASLEDLDYSLTCYGCDQEAVALLEFERNCCVDGHLHCVTHRDNTLAVDAECGHLGWVCRLCGADIGRLVRVIPL